MTRAAKAEKPYTADVFRAELTKILPGYSWTVHRAAKDATRLSATGIQSNGFNRLSTLIVNRSTKYGSPWYEAKSAGYGTRAPFRGEVGDTTLARALRCLQDLYEAKSNTFGSLARTLKNARAPSPSEIARLGGDGV
jgi:hypothetical protein